MKNVMESATEAELGGLLENFQKSTSMRTALSEMGHQQPPTPVAMDNTEANSIVNGTAKQKNVPSNRHEILLGQRQNPTKPFPHILGIEKKNWWAIS